MSVKTHARYMRRQLLSALFTEGAKAGLGSEFIREQLAPDVIGKRLSAATNQEILRVLESVTRSKGKRKYESSKAGLLEELEDAARARWGVEYVEPLNKFINSRREAVVTHYRFLKVAELKAFKDRIKELNRKDGL